jgi:hypothetical protein
MKTEITIKSADALEALKLIWQYQREGGSGFDLGALERVADALNEADRIVIIPAHEADQ